MAVLELVHSRPDWLGALTVALTRPPGVPERRAGDDPWQEGAAPGMAERPRRISDDLAWLRQAYDEPEEPRSRAVAFRRCSIAAGDGCRPITPEAMISAAVADTWGVAIEVPTKLFGRWND